MRLIREVAGYGGPMSIILALGRQKQENHKFEATLG